MKIKIFLFCFLFSAIFTIYAATSSQQAKLCRFAFMTARDMTSGANSNITIINGAGQTLATAGLFIASVDNDADNCMSCTGNIIGGDNAAGTMIGAATFTPGQSLAIGQNYLYNMIYNEIYFIRTNASSPCALPGCSWPGDTANTKWCLTINVISKNSNYTYSNYKNGSNPSAQAPAYAAAGNFSPFDYSYDLINPNTLAIGNACLGPITCNDKTQTCTVSTPQNETIRAY
ncbi:MAG TPA: hypothetical protein VJK30_06130 [Coxiellaceae bacterium]|nr:MAG: hypothetical protein A3E81_06070 [Gammaproteobacteria bacterium RIFCSPHIGHO2_12_FULL_36_30]HLB56885.1 hypothetical protein [Coxiellaceae bacterium]